MSFDDEARMPLSSLVAWILAGICWFVIVVVVTWAQKLGLL